MLDCIHTFYDYNLLQNQFITIWFKSWVSCDSTIIVIIIIRIYTGFYEQYAIGIYQ